MDKQFATALSLLFPVLIVDAAEPAPLLDTVVVTAHQQPLVLADLAGNTAVIDDEEITRSGYAHVQQLLNNAPGVNIARGNGIEYLPAVRSPVLTGAAACGSIRATLDGVALRAPGFCNINELFEAPLEFAERVEVVRGTASMVHGANATNGVIDTRLRLPERDRSGLSLWHGEQGFAKAALDLSRGDAQRGQSLGLAHIRNDGFRQDNTYRQTTGLWQLQHSGTTGQLRASIHFADLDQDSAGYVSGYRAYEDTTLSEANPTPGAYRAARSIRGQVRVGTDERDQQGRALSAWFRDTNMAFRMHFLPGQPDEENSHASVGARAGGWLPFAGGRVDYGTEAELTDAYLEQFQAEPTEGSAFLQATIPAGYQYRYDVMAASLSVFGSYRRPLSEALVFDAGLRTGWTRYDYDNHLPDGRTDANGEPCAFGGCRYSRPADRADDFVSSAVRAGLAYRMGESLQFYANLSNGYRTPQAAELYRLQRVQQVADLDPEQAFSGEVGIRGSIARVEFELAAYQQRKRNVIYRNADFFNVSGGKTAHRGLESRARVSLTDRTTFSLLLNYGEHRYRNDQVAGTTGNLMDSAPLWFGGASIDQRIGDRWNVRAALDYVGKYYTDPQSLHQYPGHRLLHLTADRQFTDSVTVFLKLENALDERYASRADFSSFSGDRYFPGSPRVVRFGAKFEL
ncbi:TonB-dependent receptor [Biformimicrobium ophioploci]|uniref:TonB-dependent receptor n=1 Tax=Biformimicrobium ophioploci TaxID=3036711 RepID=A0ABQ6LV51_9GAMM|nr:TonB-dependent receptor [Microbulbifer sp. NKW57]GMG85976.1 hypothetical protein MNKW57_02970 [Microbulbifer sp. NKW57]